MPLKNPNVGDKSSQFSTDYPTSSIYADPAAGLSSLCQHIGGPWPVDSNWASTPPHGIIGSL